MATVPLSAQVRGSRRIRIFFTGPLASGAFSSTTPYVVTSTSNIVSVPIVTNAVFAISTDPNAVEIEVNVDLIAGAQYTLTLTNVPTQSAPNFSGTIPIYVGQPIASVATPQPNVEPETSDIDLLLYGRDLYWNGSDIQETPGGDLATLWGQNNYLGAITRRVMSNGLTWDPGYGGKIQQYVDAPDVMQTPLAANVVSQARADDRTAQASVTVQQMSGTTDGGQWSVAVQVTGTDGLQPQTINIPLPSSS